MPQVGLGLVLHEADNVFSPSLGGLPVDDIIAVALLLFFGVRTLQVPSPLLCPHPFANAAHMLPVKMCYGVYSTFELHALGNTRG